jgi:hypothetical protein
MPCPQRCASDVLRRLPTWRVIATLLLLSCLAAAEARAATAPRLNTLRLDGYVGPPPAARHEVADLWLRAGAGEVRFQVTDARVIAGGSRASTILREVRRFRPNFTLRGPAELVARVADAPLGARLRLIGTCRIGARDLSLTAVEILPDPTAGPR